ncbi:NUDIX domain-containing protein [Lysobacter pythonis]|uniref:NUDIX domain-containing protein n=1 Tax=Solilutibacter pythonis TaxID=2483112 RepID=A0A3M2HCR9_9GAMM|nr:NUDIX hydrolase [Lysobacter pythonis]RMH87546.1 NUDIX domain-containing protein [Lysobacter pythonis]
MTIFRFLRNILGRRPRHLQVAALCLRGAGESREVLLITTRGRGRWILPKGWPMKDRGLAAAALQEAWEEAGVIGAVGETALGRYRYLKPGRGRGKSWLEVWVFPVEVRELAEDYPEAGQRQRRWWPLAEAVGIVEEPQLAAFLRRLSMRG